MHAIPFNPETFARNLAVLAHRSPEAARRIYDAPERTDIEFGLAPDGAVWATIGGRQLASRRAPLAEGEALAATIDPRSTAAVVVNGFGVGHHLRALALRLGMGGALFVFEPDVSLLRSVFGRVDCSGWLALANFTLFTNAEDQAAIAGAITGCEGLFASGTRMVDHPASRARLGESLPRFSAAFASVMQAVRTQVVTTLVQVDTTLRNLLQNLDWYCRVPGIADLSGCAKGRAAVVVSAGPSLNRTIDQLLKPGVRERVVIIAVQTVLRTLLERGIRPHFVTALDYHEISRRFYEGLSASDVEGITLVVEPKANPAILSAYPGAIRCVGDDVLDRVLGERLRREMGALKPGATVAHLAYAFARFLGCDPVILTGQDLAFTDGQYYAPGAAIHRVWGCELGPFNTLEMMEWQRIVRMRPMLRRIKDHLGRDCYTDEQMNTYLVQFERDFAEDAAKGLRVIDATEGGAAKAHTTAATMREALAPHLALPPWRMPTTPAPLGREDRLTLCEGRMRQLRAEVWRVGEHARAIGGVLREMLANHHDQPLVNRLIEKSHTLSRRLEADETAHALVQYVNQTGQLRRFKADRAINTDGTLTPLERQRRQIERDIDNVTWLADAADHLGSLLEDALSTLRGPVKITADAAAPPTTAQHTGETATVASGPARLIAVIPFDPGIGSLGMARDLAHPFTNHPNLLRATLARLEASSRVRAVVLATTDPDKTRALLEGFASPLPVHIERIEPASFRAHLSRVGAARQFSRRSWRSGPGTLTVFDELLHAPSLLAVMEKHEADSAVLLGPDWCLVDATLLDALADRHLARPETMPLAFSQSPPGLAPCIVSRALVRELAASKSHFATIGGLVGYVPTAPRSDPIAKPSCLSVPHEVRDFFFRCIADTPLSLSVMAAAAARPELARRSATTEQLVGALRAASKRAEESPPPAVEHLHLTLPLVAHSPDALLTRIEASVSGFGYLSPALTVEWPSALAHHDAPWWRAWWNGTRARLGTLVSTCRAAGSGAVHLRLPAPTCEADADAMFTCGADVLSIDIPADSEGTLREIAGRDDFARVLGAMDHLRTLRTGAGGSGGPWIVPRITRRDATYADIEGFFDRWLMVFGAAIIDPAPRAAQGERIAPLPLPPHAAKVLCRVTRRIDLSSAGAATPEHAGAMA